MGKKKTLSALILHFVASFGDNIIFFWVQVYCFGKQFKGNLFGSNHMLPSINSPRVKHPCLVNYVSNC